MRKTYLLLVAAIATLSVYSLEAPCLMPTSGMNLLNTNAIAYQTSFLAGLNASPNQACDGVQFDVTDSALVATDITQPQYWQAQFTAQTLIQSVLVINMGTDTCGPLGGPYVNTDCAGRISSWQLQIGSDLAAAFTDCNIGPITSGGWWVVSDTNCLGLYFRISDASQNINFYEISLYNYRAIQTKATLVRATSSLNSIANALSNIVITSQTTLSNYCQASDPTDLKPQFNITFPANVRVKGVVLTGISGNSQSQATNVDVYVGNSLCGRILDFSQYAEIGCGNRVGNVVMLQKSASDLQFCGFGILTDCNCPSSSFDNFVSTPVTSDVGYPPVATRVQTQMQDVVSVYCGAGTCGANKMISYTLADGSPVPWPYNGLSLTQATAYDTLTITPTQDLVGTYSITIRLELQNYSTIFKVQVFTWIIASNKCKNPTDSFNLLDVNAIATQTNFVANYDTNSGVGCNRVMILASNAQVVAASSKLPSLNRAWIVNLTVQAQIQTVLIVGHQNSQYSNYVLRFGNNAAAELNEVCFDRMTNGGWWPCYRPLSGSYFSVTSDLSEVDFMEAMIYNQQAIQLKAKVQFTSSLAGQIPANILSNIVSINTGSSSCQATETESNPEFNFQLNAVTQINAVVVLPNEDPMWTAYQSDVAVWVIDISVEQKCGKFADYNTYSEVKCSQIAGSKVSLKKSGTTSLRFCGIGILSNCDCTTSSFDPKLMPYYTDTSPSTQSLTYTVGGPPQTFSFMTNDTVSLVCGRADGVTQCGKRTVTAWNKVNGSAVGFFQVNASNITLQTASESDVGHYFIAVRIQLDQFSSVKFEFEITVKILSNLPPDPCPNATLQLVSPVLPLTYSTELNHWVDSPHTLIVPAVTDSVSKPHNTNACGPITYQLTNAPDQVVQFDPSSLNLLFQTKNTEGIVSGVFHFTVVASLSRYIKVPQITFTYTFNLIACTTEVVPTQNLMAVVIIANDSPKEISLAEFTMTVSCGYVPVSYKVTGATENVSLYPTVQYSKIGLQSKYDQERKFDLIITPEYTAYVRPQIMKISPMTINVHVLNQGVRDQKNATEDRDPPVWIDSISALGLTTILFREELMIPDNMSNLTSKQIKLDFKQATDNSDPIQAWNWTFQNLTSKLLVIQLNFTSPLKVSKFEIKDELSVLFLDPTFFISKLTKTGIMQPDTIITHEIPKQFESLQQMKIAEATAGFVGACQYGALAGVLIAQLFGKTMIKQIFSFFMMSQLFLMTEHFEGIQIPANMSIVIKNIKEILNMEAIPKDKIKAWLFNQVQEWSRYDVQKSMDLVGIFIGIGFGFALVILLLYFASKKIPKVRSILGKVKDVLFFGTIIVSIQTTYLRVAYSGTLSIKGYLFGESSVGNMALGIFLLILLILYLITVQVLLTKQTKAKLDDPKRIQIYGALYKSLTLKKESLKSPGIFYARRLAVGVLTAGMSSFPLQCHICMYLSIMVGGFVIGERPMINRTEQLLEAINEVTLLVLYTVEIAFCSVVVGVHEDEVRVVFGWVVNTIYSGCMGVNLAFFFYNEVVLVIRKKIQKYVWLKKVKRLGLNPDAVIENKKIKKDRKKSQSVSSDSDQPSLRQGELSKINVTEQKNSSFEAKDGRYVSFGLDPSAIDLEDQKQIENDQGNEKILRQLFPEQPPQSNVIVSDLKEAEIRLEHYNRSAHNQLEELKAREALVEKQQILKDCEEKLKTMRSSQQEVQNAQEMLAEKQQILRDCEEKLKIMEPRAKNQQEVQRAKETLAGRQQILRDCEEKLKHM